MSDRQREKVARDLLISVSPAEKLTIKKVLAEYTEVRGWKPSTLVFGYLIGLGFSPYKANQLQCELLEEFRRG